jgi:hypothetical protein
MSVQDTIAKSIMSTMSEIKDILKKSSGLPEDETKEESQDPALEAGTNSPAPEESATPSSEETAAPMSEETSTPEQEEAPAEGQEGQESEESAEQHAATLSDEELSMMLQVLQQESAKRQQAQAAQASQAGAPDQLQQSVKEDYAKMQKSVSEMSAQLTSLTQELASIKSGKPVSKPATKAAASSPKDFEVLSKSVSASKRLSKSETMSFIEGQIRKGNKLVNSGIMASVNLANDEELAKIQDDLEISGVNLPKGR